jgi:fumarate hydratase subunit alpha
LKSDRTFISIGGNLYEAVNNGVHNGYISGYLRCSVVSDPLRRVNTKDNTPAVIHTTVVDGENVKITVAPKGFGSENMRQTYNDDSG